MKTYIIGLNVASHTELPEAAKDIQSFIDTLGVASSMEIQVSINPTLSYAESTHAIGFVENESYVEEDFEDKNQ